MQFSAPGFRAARVWWHSTYRWHLAQGRCGTASEGGGGQRGIGAPLGYGRDIVGKQFDEPRFDAFLIGAFAMPSYEPFWEPPQPGS